MTVQKKTYTLLLTKPINGAKLSKTLKNAPEKYDKYDVLDWQQRVTDSVLKVTRE